MIRKEVQDFMDSCRSDSEAKDGESELPLVLSVPSDEDADLSFEEKLNRDQTLIINKTSEKVFRASASDNDEEFSNSSTKDFKFNQNESILFLRRYIKKLQSEFNSVSSEVRGLKEESSTLKNKLAGLEKERIAGVQVIKQNEYLEKLAEDKDRQIKDLWNVIQTIDDENIELVNQAEIWSQTEKQLKKEIDDLMVSVLNCNQRSIRFVPDTTIDWRLKMRQDVFKSRRGVYI